MNRDESRPTRANGRGVDASPSSRPGVPMRPDHPAPTPGAHVPPARQRDTKRVTKRRELPRLPPVFGTRQPPRLFSGLLRRTAYRIPEHEARHWLLLLVADRVDVAEHRAERYWPLVAGLFGWAAIRRLRRG